MQDEELVMNYSSSNTFANICLSSFDADLPIVCDDEYWVHPDPEKAFKQPPDKPSKVVFFNYVLRLSQIHGFALRTIVSISMPRSECLGAEHVG